MCTGIKVLAFTAHRNAVGSYPSWVRGLKRLKGPTNFGRTHRTLHGYGD